MNTYRISLRGFSGSRDIIAATAAVAKYQHFLNLDGVFDNFKDYLDAVESVHKVDPPEQRAVDAVLRFNKVKEARNLPHAYLGQTVRVGDRYGTLVGGNASMNFDVMINGIRYNVHPCDIVFPTAEGEQKFAYEHRHDICVGDRFLWHFSDGYGTSGNLPKKYMYTSNYFRGDMVLTVCRIYESRNSYGPFVDYILSVSGKMPEDGEGSITINGPDARKMEKI